MASDYQNLAGVLSSLYTEIARYKLHLAEARYLSHSTIELVMLARTSWSLGNPSSEAALSILQGTRHRHRDGIL